MVQSKKAHSEKEATTSSDLRIEYIDFENIQKWPRNPKDHDLHEIRKSFYRFGFISPVIVDEKSELLVAGHGRIDTLQLLRARGDSPPRGVQVVEDKWLVPVLRGAAFKDISEAEAFLLADNRLGEIGGWNKDILAVVLEEMSDVEDSLLDGTGFDIADVIQLTGTKEEKSELSSYEDEYSVVVYCGDESEQTALIESLKDKVGVVGVPYKRRRKV